MGPHLTEPISSTWHDGSSLLSPDSWVTTIFSFFPVATYYQEPGSSDQDNLHNLYTIKYSPSLWSFLFCPYSLPWSLIHIHMYAPMALKFMSTVRTSPITSVIWLPSQLLLTYCTSSKWAFFRILCTFQTQSHTFFFCGHTSFICLFSFLTHILQVPISKASPKALAAQLCS